MADKNSSKLRLPLFSGGEITIDRSKCLSCTTQACVKNCLSSTMEPVLRIRNGRPELSRNDMPTEKGWCIECMACELDCSLYGKSAISIRFKKEKSE